MMRLTDNKFFKIILPNIAIVLSCMMITLLILDYYNPLMGFLSRGMSVAVIAVWLVAVILYFATTIIRVACNVKARKGNV